MPAYQAAKYFQGEQMTCTLCGCTQTSDRHVESNWRVIEADGKPYYFCPREFPPDGASRFAFEAAYDRAVRQVANLRQRISRAN